MSVAVVTGAGSGVGRALSVELAKRGWSVALLGHGERSLEETAGLIDRLGAKARAYEVDVADSSAVQDVADRVVEAWGPPAAWVNAAAVGLFGPLEKATDEDLDRVMAVSYNGVVHGSQAAARVMSEGAIVNIGSSLAFASVPYNVQYAASKAAVRSYSLGLGMELRNGGIKVCIAHLPAVATPWFKKVKTLTAFRSRPVGPVHSPESIAVALADLVQRPRSGDVYLGIGTVGVVIAARIAPRLTAWVGATVGVRLQTTSDNAPDSNNLYASVEPPPRPPRFKAMLHRPPHWWPRTGRRR